MDDFFPIKTFYVFLYLPFLNELLQNKCADDFEKNATICSGQLNNKNSSSIFRINFEWTENANGRKSAKANFAQVMDVCKRDIGMIFDGFAVEVNFIQKKLVLSNLV